MTNSKNVNNVIAIIKRLYVRQALTQSCYSILVCINFIQDVPFRPPNIEITNSETDTENPLLFFNTSNN